MAGLCPPAVTRKLVPVFTTGEVAVLRQARMVPGSRGVMRRSSRCSW